MREIEYIKATNQKCCILGRSGCSLYAVVYKQIINEAELVNGNLTIKWVDLTNANVYIPLSLIQTLINYNVIPPSTKS